MNDDLVKRLRCYADINHAVYHPWVYTETADRIAKLEAANLQQSLITVDHLSRIEKLEAALNRVVDLTNCWESSLVSQVNEIAREALEEKDD